MKKVLLALFAVAFAASMCFAEEASAPSGADNNATPAPAQSSGSSTPSASAGATTFTGTVDLVSNGSSISGAGQQITVKDDQGLETTFLVASDTTIIGKDGNATTLSWISKDDKVAIEYTATQNGTKTAKSIKVSSSW